MPLSEGEVATVVKKTVHETLLALGVDVEDPTQVQRDFAALRSWRTSMETVRRQGLIVAIGIMVSGLLALVWTSLHGGSAAPPHN